MTVSFNLVDEPWIPVVWPSGTAGEVGLRDALVQAHEIRELVDGSPLVTVSLHRLLLAILRRNFGPATFEAWKELWRRGHWDTETLDAYFADWRHRFDLFDSERPFYQVAALEEGTKVHPPALLAQELASGNNATLFDHSFAGRAAPMRPAEAARTLIARQAFAVGGGVSKPFNLSHAPLTVGFTVLAVGGTLFETLALNLIEQAATDARDQPVWEQETTTQPNSNGSRPRGILDQLTWQSRRIKLLVAEEEPVVVGCQLAQNLKLAADIYDPFKSYGRSKEEGWTPRRLDPDRAVWRDSHAILQQSSHDSLRPAVCNWLARVDEARGDGEIEAASAYPLSVLGLGREATAKAADVSIWRHERFTVPLAYLHDEQLLGELENALILAEDVGRLLQPGRVDIEVGGKKQSVARPFQALAEVLLPSVGGRPDRKRVNSLIEHLAPDRRYWSRLETPFRELLQNLPENADEALAAWAVVLRRAAWDAFGEATSGLDRSARALEAVARAERELGRRLADRLGPYLSVQTHLPVQKGAIA